MKVSERLTEKYAGLFVRNLDKDLAVKKMQMILKNSEIQELTGLSQTLVSQIKNGRAKLNTDAQNKLFEFYIEMSKSPLLEEMPDIDTIAYYTSDDAKAALSDIKAMFSQIENIIENTKRTTVQKMRTVRDNSLSYDELEAQKKKTIERIQKIEREASRPNDGMWEYVSTNDGHHWLTDDRSWIDIYPYTTKEEYRASVGYADSKWDDLYNDLTIKERQIASLVANIRAYDVPLSDAYSRLWNGVHEQIIKSDDYDGFDEVMSKSLRYNLKIREFLKENGKVEKLEAPFSSRDELREFLDKYNPEKNQDVKNSFYWQMTKPHNVKFVLASEYDPKKNYAE